MATDMALGLVYLTGGGKKGKRDEQPKTITLGFYDRNATGASFKYVRLALHVDDSASVVAKVMSEISGRLNNGQLDDK